MCTVIYIPTEKGAYLCSVRDENPFRERALFPEEMSGEKYRFWAPIDPKAGGTWWTINQLGNMLILLNGAFNNHLPNTRLYRKSRGLIIKELSQETNLHEAWTQINLKDIEPFTLILKSQNELVECRWNGQSKFWKKIDQEQAHIWSSATLYPLEVRRKRELLFYDFISKPVSKTQDIEDFLFQHSEPSNGFIMHRFEEMRSLSISTIAFDEIASNVEISYHDLLDGKKNIQTIQLTTI
ncbi:NRDE family protein [Fluviicola taffensis]|uniref:NRDE family protein n=1 Tax=Fluviicola taffensis TaxID=191579 RepID=UPI003137A90F